MLRHGRIVPPIPGGLALLLVGPAAFAQIHVDDDATGASDGTSWQDAFTDLQAALAVARGGDEIWLAEGLYLPSTTGDRAESFELGDNVRIYGGFLGVETSLDDRLGSVHETILSGDLLGDDGPGFTNRADNSLHVVTLSWFDTGGLDRVTVRGGHADLPGEDLGGGVYSPAGPFDLAVDCVFTDNYAAQGGGVWTSGITSVHGCTFLANRAEARGGGLYVVSIQSATPSVERCRFLGNEVVGPTGEGGGLWGGWGDVVFCEFSGNAAALGGGLNWSGYAMGLTIAGNTAYRATGGAVLSATTLRSSILWDNTDPGGATEGAQVSAGVGEVNESCIQGWTGVLGGARNLSADPRFVDPAGADGIVGTLDDDLALRRGSPCIDRGEVPYLLPPLDLRGQPRLVDALDCGDGGVIDMGAIERQALDGTTNYCAATPSSLGVPATISAPCVQSVFLDPVLDLEAGPVPGGGGLFLVGPEPARLPLGNGYLCVWPPKRLVPARAVGGVMSVGLDLTAPPGSEVLVPGSTWFVQAVYRDVAGGGAGFNTSDAASLEIRD